MRLTKRASFFIEELAQGGAAVVLGDGEADAGQEDTSLLNGLALITWMVTWAAAVITFAFGTGLGAKRPIALRR